MIVILEPDLPDQAVTVDAVRTVAARYPGVTVKPYEFKGTNGFMITFDIASKDSK